LLFSAYADYLNQLHTLSGSTATQAQNPFNQDLAFDLSVLLARSGTS
jgi:hypothetical protein